MKAKKILICDDDRLTHEILSVYLNAEELRCHSVFNGRAALEKIANEAFDLVILDIMMPGLLGTDVCREIRKFSEVPIIMISAKDDEIDRILGLELGADDYIVKPFSPREVVLRIKKILTRLESGKNLVSKRIQQADLIIDLDQYVLKVSGDTIECTPKELELLYYLVKNTGKVFSREQLLSEVWGYDYFGDTRAVDTQIKRLRKKMEQTNHAFEIKSVYGIGYKFEVLQ
ncbi:MAG: response regulator transcription factor [Firmicutes bacterium]|nr:response regulator transcription factor [Bacillota bacterium]